MKKIILLILSFILTQPLILAQEITVAKMKESIQNFKNEADQKLSLIRDELTSKRYPQAHFIKSIQFQLNDLQFNTMDDFRSADEILNNLVKGISSQSSVYKDNKKIVVDNNVIPLGSLKKLRKEFIQYKTQNLASKKISSEATGFNYYKAELQKIFNGSLRDMTSSDFNRVILMACAIFIGLSFFVKEKKQNAPGKTKKTTPPHQALASKKEQGGQASSFGEILQPVCQIDNAGNLLFENANFLRTFGKQKSWKDFLQNNFKIDEEFKGNPKPFIYLRNQNQSFFMSISSNEADKTKLIVMHKVERAPIVQAKKKVVSHKAEKFTTLDLLENSIARMNSFRSGAPLATNEAMINEKIELNLSQESIQRVFDHYLRILNEISKLKSTKSEINIFFTREEREFRLCAVIPNASLANEDLHQSILSNGRKTTLQIGLNDFSQLLSGVKTRVSLKNITTQSSKGISIQVIIDDQVSTIHKNKFENSSPSV